MKAHFWSLPFKCPQCGTNCAILEVASCADGDLQFSGCCVLCGGVVEKSWSNLQRVYYCFRLDEKKEAKVEVPKEWEQYVIPIKGRPN
jgi:hypothetical protein